MQWGSQLEYLERLREDMGIMPRGLANRPEIHELGGGLQKAFNTLSSCRQFGMGGPLPISITEMLSYCLLFRVEEDEERETFVALVQRLDGVYMEEMAKRSANASKSDLGGNTSMLDNPAKG